MFAACRIIVNKCFYCDLPLRASTYYFVVSASPGDISFTAPNSRVVIAMKSL